MLRLALPALAAAAISAAPASAQASPAEMGKLQAENALLQRQLDLASGENFYLVLDPSASSLKLMLKGAVLQDYAVQGIEVGTPRLAFATRALPEGWRGKIWSGGNLVPRRELDRYELVAPPPSNNPDEDREPSVPIPPTPEEKYPVPHRFHVRFEGGLSIEVRRLGETEDEPGFWSGLGKSFKTWWADAKAVTTSVPESDDVRLRITLRSKDAESFYRALPPDTKLLVLPDR